MTMTLDLLQKLHLSTVTRPILSHDVLSILLCYGLLITFLASMQFHEYVAPQICKSWVKKIFQYSVQLAGALVLVH